MTYIVLAMCAVGVLAAAQTAETPHGQLTGRCREMLKGGDTFAVIQFLDEQPDPLLAANVYSALLNDLYWKDRSLPLAIAIGRAGIQHGLSRARQSGDAQIAERLKGAAKAMAYNVGSFTWDGWDEQGIAPSPTDLAIGLDAAKLNLRLAVDLKRDAGPMSDAHWLVGAHQLSAGEYAAARASFAQARQLATGAPAQLMADGYGAIGMVLAKEPLGQAKLDEAIAALLKEGSEDAKFFAAQLKTAMDVFRRRIGR